MDVVFIKLIGIYSDNIMFLFIIYCHEKSVVSFVLGRLALKTVI